MSNFIMIVSSQLPALPGKEFPSLFTPSFPSSFLQALCALHCSLLFNH